ncbi:hypothetical protein DPEC_G00353030 [Dallia pectoralis]|uniref:Uncharacterized protein n=1 Tax=Dallia pectoralis TaxID=75939 RepID=A0ACC2F2F5_DALPE|nr:hypothetical protein DPEC_G00353030 [Dallia pectoralis]
MLCLAFIRPFVPAAGYDGSFEQDESNNIQSTVLHKWCALISDSLKQTVMENVFDDDRFIHLHLKAFCDI